MKNWSISAGKFFGTEVRVHLTFFLLLFFVWVTQSNGRPGEAWRGLALVALIFASVILHELGHAVVGSRAGSGPRSVILLPIGGVSLMDGSRQHAFEENASVSPAQAWKKEIRIAVAGPIVSLLIGLAAAGVLETIAPGSGLWTRPLVHAQHLFRSAVWVNVFLAAFNMLPAYPLDGGRVLRSVFLKRMDRVHATRRAVTIGQAFALAFMFVGMLWNVWFALIGFFMFVGVQLEERSVVFQSVLEKVFLEDVMLTDFATLSPADTLEDALNKAVHCLQDDFPVIRGSDMVGVVSKQTILEALRAQGNGYVQSVMQKVYEVAQRQETLASAFRKITSRGMTIIPVVEDQHLVGIVTLQNLMHSMALLAETRKLRREALES